MKAAFRGGWASASETLTAIDFNQRRYHDTKALNADRFILFVLVFKASHKDFKMNPMTVLTFHVDEDKLLAERV